LKHRCHHHHAVIALGIFELSGLLPELIVVPIGLELHTVCDAIKSFQRCLHIEILGATQPFGAEQVHHCDVTLLQIIRPDGAKFREIARLLEFMRLQRTIEAVAPG
jgi:hypothetical protein